MAARGHESAGTLGIRLFDEGLNGLNARLAHIENDVAIIKEYLVTKMRADTSQRDNIGGIAMTGSRAGALRAIYHEPNERAALKVLDHLDIHCRNFIALSPFLVLSTTSAQGRVDASPRGDPPGFVAVPDERTLLLPDRPGNNQIDSLRNLVEQPRVGLLFFVPGMNETLRVKGTAEIVTAPTLLASLSVGGKVPAAALRVTVEEAFLHCGRALIRSRLWDPAIQIERSVFPTYGQVLADQIAGADAEEIDAAEEEANRTQLY